MRAMMKQVIGVIKKTAKSYKHDTEQACLERIRIEAIVNIAEQKGITYQSVTDKLTRKMNIKMQEFDALLKSYLEHGSEDLKEFLMSQSSNSEERNAIISLFNEMRGDFIKQNSKEGYSLEHNEVFDAFEILLEEIEDFVEVLNNEGAEAFKKSDYNSVEEIKEHVAQVVLFREKAKELQKEWNSLSFQKTKKPTRGHSKEQTVSKRLKRGLRTSEDFFQLPILEVLTELGGKAPMKDVLERVYGKIKHQLNEYDHQPIKSNPDQPRWMNTAQWCRNSMVKEGLLSSESPKGIWEISEAGKQKLEREKRQ